MRQMAVNLAGVELKNPVMTASGTFGSGAEYGEMVDLNKLGAVVTKGVANVPWPGNPNPAYCGGVRRHDLTRSAYRIRGMIYLHRGISRFYVSMIRRLSSMYVEKRRKITSM